MPGIQRIQDHHREIVRRLVIGQRPSEIARALGLSVRQVSAIKNSEVVRRFIDMLQTRRDEAAVDIRRQIEELAPQAVEVLREAMESEESPWAIRVRAAMDVLDRAGHSAPKRHHHLHGVFTAQDLEEIKRRARQAGVLVGREVEEASYEEVEDEG